MLTDALREALRRAQQQVNSLLLGKAQEVRLAFVALLSGGHVLIEDLPGLGKTTLAHALASSLGLAFQRVQFTSDLLPADVLGVSVYDAPTRQFQFHPGPVFAQVLLADEINRAPPRTQSALLEAMAEHQVTLDGTTHALPRPFFVIATQNPVDLSGTFPLPDSQLDRFLLRLTLGYPNPESERALLSGGDRRDHGDDTGFTAQHVERVVEAPRAVRTREGDLGRDRLAVGGHDESSRVNRSASSPSVVGRVPSSSRSPTLRSPYSSTTASHRCRIERSSSSSSAASGASAARGASRPTTQVRRSSTAPTSTASLRWWVSAGMVRFPVSAARR